MPNRAFASLLAVFVTGCGFRLGYDLHEHCAPDARDCTTDPSDLMGDGLAGDGTVAGDGAASRDGDALDGATGDGDPGEDGGIGPAPGCGSLSLLRDNFEGPANAARFFTLGQGDGELDAGHLRLRPAAGQRVTYNAQNAYDFREAAMEVRLLRAGAAVQGIALRDGKSFDRFSQPLVPDEAGVALQVAAGQLQAVELNGATEHVLASAVWDAATQAYLRLREADGSVWFETSPDGLAWSAFHRAVVAMDPALVFATMFAGSGPDSGAETWFDDLNTAQVEVLGYCPISDLQDSLDDDSLGPELKPWNGAGHCTVEEWQGNVELTYAGEFAACALAATPRFDLRDDALYVEFDVLLSEGPRSTMLELAGETGARLQFTVASGGLVMSVSDGSAVTFETRVALGGSLPRFLVLGERAGTLYFGTSDTRGDLQMLAETPTSIDVTALVVSVWGFDSGSDEASSLRIASLNLP